MALKTGAQGGCSLLCSCKGGCKLLSSCKEGCNLLCSCRGGCSLEAAASFAASFAAATEASFMHPLGAPSLHAPTRLCDSFAEIPFAPSACTPPPVPQFSRLVRSCFNTSLELRLASKRSSQPSALHSLAAVSNIISPSVLWAVQFPNRYHMHAHPAFATLCANFAGSAKPVCWTERCQAMRGSASG